MTEFFVSWGMGASVLSDLSLLLFYFNVQNLKIPPFASPFHHPISQGHFSLLFTLFSPISDTYGRLPPWIMCAFRFSHSRFFILAGFSFRIFTNRNLVFLKIVLWNLTASTTLPFFSFMLFFHTALAVHKGLCWDP